MNELAVPTPTGLILSLLNAALKHRDHLPSLIKSYRYIANEKIRVSMACLIKFEHEGHYILAKNRLRPECISPYGGVIKFYESARPFLAEIEYQPENKYSQDSEFQQDLRGYLRPKDFGSFMTWFKSRRGREQSETVSRELEEEFPETRIPREIHEVLASAKYSLHRVVHEGPYSNDHQSYATFRYLEIYQPEHCPSTNAALAELALIAASNKCDAFIVTREEILKCRRDDGLAIAGSAKYFFSKKWHGQEPTQF